MGDDEILCSKMDGPFVGGLPTSTSRLDVGQEAVCWLTWRFITVQSGLLEFIEVCRPFRLSAGRGHAPQGT